MGTKKTASTCAYETARVLSRSLVQGRVLFEWTHVTGWMFHLCQMRRRDPRNSELLRWHAKIRPRGPQEGRDRPEACFQRFDTGSEERATLSCGRKLPRNLGPLLSATAIPRRRGGKRRWTGFPASSPQLWVWLHGARCTLNAPRCKIFCVFHGAALDVQ